MKATGIDTMENSLRDGRSPRHHFIGNEGNSDDSSVDDTYELSNPENFPIVRLTNIYLIVFLIVVFATMIYLFYLL